MTTASSGAAVVGAAGCGATCDSFGPPLRMQQTMKVMQQQLATMMMRMTRISMKTAFWVSSMGVGAGVSVGAIVGE